MVHKKFFFAGFFLILASAAIIIAWTETITSSTPVKKTHLEELRNSIDSIRADIGLSAYSWTDPAITTETPIKAVHYNETRKAIEDIYSRIGAGAPAWGDAISAGGDIKSSHVTGPRGNLTAANSTINSYACCGRYGGSDTGSAGSCPGTDDSACGTIDCDGMNYYYQSGVESATTTESCYYRDYGDIVSSRCEGINDCKDANTADCTSYLNGLQYSCGTCKYIAASSCTGSTLGSCTNYAAGTDTGTCRECDGAGSERMPADDAACGTIDCDGMNYYYQSGVQSATTTESCYYRDYADITSNRCEGIGDCKDANTADCTSYANSLQYSCGTCKYIAASSCTGSTLGSCTNYADGTSCGTDKVCRSGSCTNQILVVLNSATSKNCNTVCSENDGRSCVSIGTNTDGNNAYYMSHTGCTEKTGYCTTLMGFWLDNCLSIRTDWTYCRCSY